MMKIPQSLSETKLLVHVLVCVFGIASWVDINGLWVELPILVTYLPEKWTLPSFIIIISQVANIGPIIFSILLCLCKGRHLEKPTSAIIILVGMVASLLLSFFWSETSILAGELHATALFVLSFLLSFVDCTSSMAFLAFMAHFKTQYLSSYFIGEGLSGMLPSLIALGQGVGQINCINGSSTNSTQVNGTWHNVTEYSVYPQYETPRFSVQVFFLIVFGLITASLLSFLLLNFLPYCKGEQVGKSSYTLWDKPNNAYLAPKETDGGGAGSKNNEHPKDLDFQTKERDGNKVEKLSSGTYVFLMINTVFVNMVLTTFLPSIQTYTSLPYGLRYYHLAATISNIANPVACFCNLLIPIIATPAIIVLTLLGSGFAAYLIVIAAMSPMSPLTGTDAGGPLAVTSWALVSFLLIYSKVGTAARLRKHGGRRAMLWYGAFTQLGASIGALTAFVIVNVYHLLQDAPFC